jgi:phage-related protein
MKDEISGPLKEQTGALEKLGGAASGIAKAGLIAATAGATALAGALTFSVKAAMEAEVIDKQLDAVLKSTAGAAGMSKEAITGLANELGGLTMFEDDAIVSAQSMLLTFTSIGKEVFPAATETVLNMSQALGQDLKSSAMQLGKALNAPVDGIAALQRVGVKFTESQKAAIEKMVEMGDIAGAQKIILAELETEFGGAAKAAGQTFSGQLTILKNNLGNVAETIGGALLPALTGMASGLVAALNSGEVQAAIATFSDMLTSLATGDVRGALDALAYGVYEIFGVDIRGAIDMASAAFAQISAFIQDNVIPAFWQIAGVVQTFVSEHAEGLKNALIAIGVVLAGAAILTGIIAIGGAIAALVNPVTLIIGAVALLAVAWTENWGGIQEKTQAVLDFIMPYVQQAITFIQTTITTIMAAVQTFWAENGDAILGKAQEIWNTIQDFIGAAIKFVQSVVSNTIDVISRLWAEKHDAIMATVNTVWALIQNVIQTTVDVIQGVITTFTNILKGDWKAAWESIKETARTLWEGIKEHISLTIDAIKGIVDVALALLKIMFGEKLEQIRAAIALKWEEVKTNVNTFLEDVKKAIGNFSLVEVGKDLIQGMINGVGSMGGALASAAANLAWQAIQAIKNALLSHSPSEVTHDIGIDFGLGFANGVYAMIPEVARQAQSMVNVAVAAAQEAQRIISGTGRGGIPAVPGDPTHPGLEPIEIEVPTGREFKPPSTGTKPPPSYVKKGKTVYDPSNPFTYGGRPTVDPQTTTRPTGGGGGGGGGGSSSAGGKTQIDRFGGEALAQLAVILKGQTAEDAERAARALEFKMRWSAT